MQGIYGDIPRLYTAIAEWGACVVQITVLNQIGRASCRERV